MNVAKVSIIIPVYKVEAYIERCAHSIFDQTLESIEFIFVDDCSPDRSIELLKAIIELYPKRREQVTILKNDTNKGVSFTRNVGLNHASGEYVIHVDSDDWVELTMMEELYTCAVKASLDIVWSDFYVDFPLNSNKIEYYSQNIVENSAECIKAILEGKMHGGLWNKLIKRDLITTQNISFPLGVNMCEDQTFVMLCLIHTDRISHLQKAFYHYVQNNNSLTLLRNRTSFESEFIGIKILEDNLPTSIYNNSLLSYKANLKSSVFLSGLFSKNEFLNCYPESVPYVVKNTNGRMNKLAIKLALKNFFILSRIIIFVGESFRKLTSYKQKK